MSSDFVGQKLENKKSAKKSIKNNRPKQTIKKGRKEKLFPWKLIVGIFAIISVMAFLSNTNDSKPIKAGSTGIINHSGLNGFNLGK